MTQQVRCKLAPITATSHYTEFTSYFLVHMTSDPRGAQRFERRITRLHADMLRRCAAMPGISEQLFFQEKSNSSFFK